MHSELSLNRALLPVTILLFVIVVMFSCQAAFSATPVLRGEIAQTDVPKTDEELTREIMLSFNSHPTGYFIGAQKAAEIDAGLKAYAEKHLIDYRPAAEPVISPDLNPAMAVPDGRNVDQLSGQTTGHLSAIGIKFLPPANIVLEVDPASDLYGQIHEGDVVLSTCGVNPQQSYAERRNFGDAGTLTEVVWLSGRHLHKAMCRRKPISSFIPEFQAGLSCPFGR